MAGVYVQYGCANCAPEGWLNFDSSPSMRLQRIPVIGDRLRRLSGTPFRFPNNVRYGDIIRGLPVAERSVSAAYASHVLEHMTLEDAQKALANTFLMLEPGGVFRLIVPDLEGRARLYLEQRKTGAADASSTFMRTTLLGAEQRRSGLVGYAKLLFGASNHLWMWDEASMRAALTDAGFTDIRRCAYGDSPDPRFERVEDPDRFIDPNLGGLPEVAIECRRPLEAPLH